MRFFLQKVLFAMDRVGFDLINMQVFHFEMIIFLKKLRS